MKLKVWLDTEGISARELSLKLDVTDGAVSLWLNGLRMPRPAVMRKIMKLSKGKVLPQDFY